MPICKEDYERFEQYINGKVSDELNEEFSNYFDGIDVADLKSTFENYFIQSKVNAVEVIYYFHPTNPPKKYITEGDLERQSLLMAWFRSRGKNAYINELDEGETGFA